MRTHRRDLWLALGATLAAPSAFALGSAGRTLYGIGYMRTVTPPSVLQHMISAKDAALLGDPVLERTTAPEVRDFREYLDGWVARERSRQRRIEEVNTYVNRKVKRIADEDLYHRRDLWAPPLNTLLVGGDCEDLALLKRWALMRVGVSREDIFLLAGVTHAIPQPTFHAILGVLSRPSNHLQLLDNLSDTVFPNAKAAKFSPTYVLNQSGFWRVENPDVADKPLWDQVSLDIQPDAPKAKPLKLG